MVDVTWVKALEELEKYIFQILTPRGAGTGFLISLSGKLCGIATAFHVVKHAHEWQGPIRVRHHRTGKQVLLRQPDRAIWIYPNEDLAFILFRKGEFKLPTETLAMKPADKHVRQGVQMGWCGFPNFPNIASSDLCFFTGHVSAFLKSRKWYLVDGVAINGVSGGPAFTVHGESPYLCGVVSAYIANRATGETLPGVCLIRDVAPYQQALSRLKSLEQAKATEEAKTEGGEQQVAKEAQPEAQKPRPKKTVKKKAARKTSKKSGAKKKAAKKKAGKKKTT